jgi:hypothetical protein
MLSSDCASCAHKGDSKMRRAFVLCLAVSAFLLAADCGFGATIHVGLGAEYTYHTIQDGINAAALSGDTVIVHDGTYTGTGNRSIDFGGRTLTLQSANGAASTIIDCQNAARGFYLHSGETTASVIEGFTVKNGYTSDTLEDPGVLDVLGSGGGGGMLFVGSGATIVDCVFQDNYGRHGGGINCQSNSQLAVVGCAFAENDAGYAGGGLWAHTSTVTISGCTFAGNSADAGGGAMRLEDCDSILTNCLIAGNSSTGTSTSAAGGLLVGDGTATIKHCTLCGNVCSLADGGSAIRCDLVTIVDCIAWGNSGDQIFSTFASDITYSDVEGGWTGLGNTNADPLFFDGYHLGGGSPCINAGTDAGVYVDLDGNVRPLLGGFDMGCYEAVPEPATIGVLALGLLVVLARLRKSN